MDIVAISDPDLLMFCSFACKMEPLTHGFAFFGLSYPWSTMVWK